MENIDQIFMQLALKQARKGAGFVAPNPMVGAVLVDRNNKVVALGHHEKFGEAHAEVNAFKNIDDASGMTLYCTLEPCCHTGKKTPPCTLMLIKKKPKRIVVGCLDPNPKVSGKGIEQLRMAGIEVTVGVLERECRELIKTFTHYTEHFAPFVHLKIAQTLDGKLATNSGDSKWISDEAARTWVHDLRGEYGAVMIGTGTMRTDNPSLNTRLSETDYPHPRRIIIGNLREEDKDLNVFSDGHADRTWVFTSDKTDFWLLCDLEERGVKVTYAPEENGLIDLCYVLRVMASGGITAVLVEGGSKLGGSFLSQNLVQQLSLVIAPKILGPGTASLDLPSTNQMKNAFEFDDTQTEMINDQILFHAFPKGETNVYRTH